MTMRDGTLSALVFGKMAELFLYFSMCHLPRQRPVPEHHSSVETLGTGCGQDNESQCRMMLM